MAALRTAHNPEPDVLRGHTVTEARELAARLARQAEILTRHLARFHASTTSTVRANLETERNNLEISAADWQARIAEATGEIVPVGEPAVTAYCRRCSARNLAAAGLSACRLCGAEVRLSEQRRAR